MADQTPVPEGEGLDRIRKAVDEVMRTRAHEDPIRQAWTLVGERGMGAVRTAVTSLPASGDAAAAVHRFLLLHVAGEPRAAALAPLLGALAEGLPIADRLLDVLETDELEEVARSREARWENLSLQVEEDAAARLFRVRCGDAIARDQVSSVAADLEHAGIAMAAATQPLVDLAVREVLAVLAWEDPARAQGIAAALGPGDDRVRGLAAHLDAGVRCAAERERFTKAHPDLTAFDRFLRLAPALPVVVGVRMARDLGSGFGENPGRYARAFHRLARDGRELLSHYASLARPLHRPDPNPARVERNCVEVVRTAREVLRGVPLHRAAALVGGFGFRRVSARVWNRRLREPLAVAIADHPAPPDAVAGRAGRRWYAPWGLRHFRGRIRTDELLWTVWWTANLRHADANATGS